MLRANNLSVLPPKFKEIPSLRSAGTGELLSQSWALSPIPLPFNAGTALKSTQAGCFLLFRFTAQRLLPQIRHEDSHRPSSLLASSICVLLLLIAFLLYNISFIKISKRIISIIVDVSHTCQPDNFNQFYLTIFAFHSCTGIRRQNQKDSSLNTFSAMPSHDILLTSA